MRRTRSRSSRPITYDQAEVFHVIFQNNASLAIDAARSLEADPGLPVRAALRVRAGKCVTSEITLKEIAPDHFSPCLRIQLKEIELAPMHLPDEVFEGK